MLQRAEDSEMPDQAEPLGLTGNLLRIAIYNISYLRGLFPEKYFDDKFVPALAIRIKKLMPMDDESRRLIDWMENGVFDTLRKRYLKTLLLRICEEDTPVNEEYTFSFNYSNNTSSEVTMKLRCTGTKRGSTTFKSNAAEATPYEIRTSACKMVRKLIALMRNFNQMSGERTFLTKLLYDDVTPEDYKPPFLECCACNEAVNIWNKISLKMEVGNTNSKHFVLAFKVKSFLDSSENFNGGHYYMGMDHESDQGNHFSDNKVQPSEDGRYIVAPNDGNCKGRGTISEDDTQDAAHEEELTTQAKEWICSRDIGTINVSDVLSKFPDIPMEMVEGNAGKEFCARQSDLHFLDILEQPVKDNVLCSAVNQPPQRTFGYVLCSFPKKIEFMLDSGATHHICKNKNIMQDLKDVKEEDQVIVQSCGGVSLRAEKMGSVVMKDFRLCNVGYIPQAAYNVVSVGQLASQGLLISTGNRQFSIYAIGQSKLVGEGFLQRKKDSDEYIFKTMNWDFPNKEKLVESNGIGTFPGPESEKDWVIDTGCAKHVVSDMALLENPRPEKQQFQGAAGVIWSTHKGKVMAGRLELKGTFHCPKLRMNLISGSMLDKDGYRITFGSQRCTIVHKDGLKEKGIGILDEMTRLYHLKTDTEAEDMKAAQDNLAADIEDERKNKRAAGEGEAKEEKRRRLQ